MLFKNAEVINKDFELEKADIAVADGIITAVGRGLSASGEVFDLDGFIVVPGLVDIHIHGCAGFDACDATTEAISEIAAHLAKHGVTSFCPATMTVSSEEIENALVNIRYCMESPPEGSRILGVNMEGPYISMNKKGGQKGDYVKNADWEQFNKFYDLSGGIIKIVDIAPECDGADEFIEQASKLCTVSIAHTDSNYEQAKAAFSKGISHVTHLFNAMSGFNHREPGVVGAVFDDERVMAELICDGFHIHPAVLRTAFRILGEDRAVIVSDSMRAAGLEDGSYGLGGQTVFVQNGQARLADGTIAGSTTNLLQEVRNLVSFGVPFRQVIKAATINPARAVREDGRIGSIDAGKAADLVVLDKELNLKMVVVQGKIIKNNI
ncbi:MAG: N-acetylglucosamine-6-phosphate deacetylase [Firmicutes bacterium HGW-Firmicutes-16]|nr:MAG: N-acetylglucosamine-6-phosphate deacetylase [Firmicutes bacterium HGW-Firmicutes-16]